MENLKSKKRPRLTRETLLQSPEFWVENIRTELFNVVQNYLEDNNMSRKQLAEKLGVSKGYISQILNGDSDHRLSKIVSLATALGKAPYIFLKDMNKVLENVKNGKSVYIDFEEIETKASRCDILDSVAFNSCHWNPNQYYNAFEPTFKLDATIFSSFITDDEDLIMTNQVEEKETENVDTFQAFANAA